MRIRVRTIADRARSDAAAERRAEWERQDGIPDRPANPDARTPIDLDLRCAGGPRVTLRPVRGKCAWVQFVDGKPQRRARIPPLQRRWP